MKGRVVFTGLCLVLTTALADGVPQGPVMNDHEVEKPEALKGKRLFFAEQERYSSDSVPAPGVKAMGKRRNPSTPFTLRYDARIESDSALRVIINGLPCDRLDLSTPLSGRMIKKIVCATLNSSGVQLQLLEDHKSIRVMRESVEIGVLTPGGKL